MNLAESKQIMLDYILESVTNGALTATAKNNDYLLLHNRLADIAQKEISQVKHIHDRYLITQNSIPNQLGDSECFNIIQHLDTDDISSEAVGSKAYYFEVDNLATIYIEEEIASVWTVLSTISNTAAGEFTAYKGLITALSSANAIRIRFSGSYPYNIRNRALYAYTFSSNATVPNYTPYISYAMPSDFIELNKIIYRGDNEVYSNYVDYYWEGKMLLLGYSVSGSFDVLYYKHPLTITASSLDTVEYEVDIEAQQLIPLYVASKVVAEEKPTLSGLLFNEYRLKLSQLSDIDIHGDNTISINDGW